MLFKKVAFWMLAASTIGLISCDKDDDNTSANYENGILIINEGAFNGTGSISHYDRTTKTVTKDIFSAANNGIKAGAYVQSCYTYGKKTYLLVNGANKIWVVNSSDFKVIDSIKGVTSPRFFLPVDNNKAYITNWSTGLDIVDLSTNKVVKSIKTGPGSEQLLRNGSNVWVLNGNGFGKDSTISIIDIASEKITKTIQAAVGPNSIVSAKGSIWVLCGSNHTIANGKGRLIEYKNEAIVNSYEVPQYASSLVVSSDGKKIFFAASGAIYSKSLTDSKDLPSKFIEKANNAKLLSPYGLGIDSKDGRLLCSDAKNYVVNSKVYFFDINSKVAQDSIETAVASNGFWFGN